MTDPVVSVLIAVKDGAAYLRETIDSVFEQTFADWELIVVDDGSTDDTPEILRSYERDDRLHVVTRETPAGPYAAANEGLRSARGRYVARLDGDDIATPDRLSTQVAYLDAHPTVEALLGGWRTLDDEGSVGAIRPVPSYPVEVLRWTLCVIPGLVHSSACMRRDALEEIGGYEELPAAADLALWCAFARRGTLAVVDDVVVYYRRHDSQITSARAGEQHAMAARVLQTHLRELTGEQWSLDDVDALHGTGRWIPVPYRAGAKALDRWERAWKADARLTAADRRILSRVSRDVRLRHLRMNAKGIADWVSGARSVGPRLVTR